MLRKATEAEITQYMDFAYNLAVNQATSGYPAYFGGANTKDNFVYRAWRSFREENREILLYLCDGRVEGWIQFYFLPEDNYLQIEGFNIGKNIAAALGEFIEYCEEKYPAFDFYCWFPEDNQEAVSYLKERGWPCTQQSWNQILHLKDYQPRPESPNVRKVTKDNFEDFRTIHGRYDNEMYWNCQRVFDDFDNWHIYLYNRENISIAYILYRDKEIFGLGFTDDIFDEEACCALLIRAANDHEERGLADLVFFQDEDDWSAARETGFQRVGKCMLFEKMCK